MHAACGWIALLTCLVASLGSAGCTSSGGPCTTSRDCPGLVCDLDRGVCVECLSSTDCLGADETCSEQRCAPIVRCDTSRQCPGQVCDTVREMCVDCLTDVDCPSGETCNDENLCRPDTGRCDSDDDCAGGTPRCDPGSSSCVACLADADCPSAARCTSDHRCVPRGTDAGLGDAGFDAGPIVDAGPPNCASAVGRCDAAVHSLCQEVSCEGRRYYCGNVGGVWAWRTGSACDDGSACTYDDTCLGGTCTGVGITCTSTTCVTRTCNGTDTCSEAVRTGEACDDGISCTAGETCQPTGTCGGGTSVICPAASTCATYACNGTATCTRIPRNVGVSCNDGDGCTLGERCQADGSCAAGSTVTCPADTLCGTYSCNGSATCTRSPRNTGTSCNDGDLCTLGDVCQASGLCGGTSTVTCPPDNLCATYACNGTASCSRIARNIGVGCNDSNSCTTGEACQSSGQCGGGTPVTCPPANTCATYTCNGTSTCTTVPRNLGVSCDDGDPATTGDACQANGTCRGAGACPSGGTLSVFSESFSTPASTGWVTGTDVGVGASQWRATASFLHGVQISGGQLEITNHVDMTPAEHGQGYAYVSAISAYDTSFFSSTLDSNAADSVVWTLNMRRNEPGTAGGGGFSCTSTGSQNYVTLGMAYVLAASSADGLSSTAATCTPSGTANGYAVILTGSASPVLRLVRFTNGLRNGTLTTIAQSAAVTPSDHFSVRVTYYPATDRWDLESRSDGATFANPRSGAYPPAVSGVDSVYTGTPLDYAGPYLQTGCCCLCDTVYIAEFDNLDVSLVCP